MTEYKGLPVAGYKPQTEDKVAIVNVNKLIEERALRQIEKIEAFGGADPRMLALGRTQIQQAFMWINRAVFQPGRIALPEDDPNGAS